VSCFKVINKKTENYFSVFLIYLRLFKLSVKRAIKIIASRYSLSGIKSRAIEFMQYLPVGAGPSSNKWPKWLLHLQRASIRAMPSELSFINDTIFIVLFEKSQPQLLENLAPERNN
jgi:hypothetical protein